MYSPAWLIKRFCKTNVLTSVINQEIMVIKRFCAPVQPMFFYKKKEKKLVWSPVIHCLNTKKKFPPTLDKKICFGTLKGVPTVQHNSLRLHLVYIFLVFPLSYTTNTPKYLLLNLWTFCFTQKSLNNENYTLMCQYRSLLKMTSFSVQNLHICTELQTCVKLARRVMKYV